MGFADHSDDGVGTVGLLNGDLRADIDAGIVEKFADEHFSLAERESADRDHVDEWKLYVAIIGDADDGDVVGLAENMDGEDVAGLKDLIVDRREEDAAVGGESCGTVEVDRDGGRAVELRESRRGEEQQTKSAAIQEAESER